MSDPIATVLRASVHRFIGRLGRDPEVSYFESGTCKASARIAINRPGAKKNDGQEPDWFGVEVWGEQAQAFADALHKGDLVDVTGRVKSESWQDKASGETRTQLVITAEQWSPVGGHAPAPAPAPARAKAPAAAPVWQGSADVDSEIPF